ncbi:hypothetical protein JTE90_027537 [Oedothorax gibbosus]|uniref:C2H2-type domain-containing protein n=1 Tax=Oedothorax gibbosus TaxID=931172 RepID=A0AAV6VLC4_9ARAC|nr:hypothetical protein JTE90_027537 [Oedothorax gibbosus]
MCEVEKKLNVSWQLVSQFVSWDFCRYMCEQSENQSSETDVLTFLRNMIVSRTEKRATEITKQEIVAKFIMEIKMIRSKSRMKCIVDLSETVKKICPELNASIANLLHHLENLLNVLEWNEDSEKDELILARIDQTVNDFTTEACKLLPLPDLLQVVSSWIHSELQAKVQKARKKPVTNHDLYQRVVNCLKEETIEPSEAKAIAEALYEDKILEKIINTDTEVEADSQQNSLIFSSQQNSLIFSSQQNSPFLKPRQKNPRPLSFQSPKQSSQPLQLFSQDDRDQEKQLDSDVLFSLNPIFPQSQQYIPGTQDSLEPSSQQSLAPSEQFRVIEGIQKLGSLNPIETYLFKPTCPEPLIPSAKPQDKVNPPVHHSEEPSETHSDLSDFSPQLIVAKNKNIRRLSSPEPEFYTAPDEVLEDNVVNVESDASSDFCPEKINPSNRRRKRYVRQIDSDLDLSDEEVPVVVQRVSNSNEKTSSKSWLNFFSDNHNGSDTSDCDQNDECRFLTPTMFKTGATQTQPNRPPPNAVIWSSDDETYNSSVVTDPPSSQHVEDPTFRIHINKKNLIASQSPPQTREKKKIVATKRVRKKQLQSPKILKTAKQMTLSGFGFSSDTSTVSSLKEIATKKVPEKKHFRLFDNDRMPSVLKPNVSNESALFEKPTLKKKPKTVPKLEELGKKRRCVECKITFKTPKELKKHVFMVHTTEVFDSTEEFM